MERAKRIICMALCFAMLAGCLPAPVHAEDLSLQGLCEHHPEHIDCSYAPAVDAVECGHQHDGTCYVQIESCIHTHDGCGTEDVPCEHICSEDTGCITVTLNCQHEHDSDCGYAEAAEAVACDYVCAEYSTQEEESPCDSTLNCVADEHSEDCEKKAADDLAAEQEATQKAEEEHTAVDQAAADATETVSGTCGENLTWTLEDGVLTISGTGAMADFALNTIPWADYRNSIQVVSFLDGVTTIGAQAFYDFSEIISIILPDSITSIGNYAFYGCSSLSAITLPGKLTTIGNYAFTGCSKIDVVSIPDSVTELGDHAFNGCTLLTTVELPKNITSIGEFTFANCNALPSISIPEGVKTIGSAAFAQCSDLTEITLPSSVSSIGWRAFVDCSGLSEIRFEGNAPDIDETAFEGLLADVTATAYYPANNPTWTEAVMQNYGGNITWKPMEETYSITLADDITNGTVVVDKSTAAEGETVTLTVTPDLDHVVYLLLYKYGTAAEDVTRNEDGTYSFVMPAADVTISASFTYPVYVSGIPVTSANAPDVLGDGAVSYNVQTNTLTLNSANIEGASLDGGNDIFGIFAPNGLNLVVGDAGATISGGAFGIQASDYLNISGGPLTIQDVHCGIFSSNYRDITIESGTITITANQAAINAGIYGSISIQGGSVTATSSDNCGLVAQNIILGNEAHVMASGANSAAYTVPVLASETDGKSRTAEDSAFVPGIAYNDEKYFEFVGNSYVCENEHSYDATHVCTVCGIIGGTCGDNLAWILDDSGTLVISGAGKMDSHTNGSSVPWWNYRKSITAVVIGNGVTRIGNYSFYACTALADVAIPDSVTGIGSTAFCDCTSLSSVVIPNSVTTIYESAFKGCTSLTNVVFGNSVTHIGDRAFYGCVSLDNVVLGDSVESVGDYVFESCTSLKSIVIPDSVTSIGCAFWNCTNLAEVHIADLAAWCNISFSDRFSNPLYYGGMLYLNNEKVTELVIPEDVTSIGNYAFNYFVNLRSVEIGNAVTNIGYCAFDSCTDLISVSIPASVTNVNSYAFYNCVDLTNIIFEGGAPIIGKDVFYNIAAVCYYPANNETWTDAVMQNYGGNITWEANYEKFAVALDAQGGTIYDAITEYAAGIVVQLPTTVMRSGYIFQGWYEGDTKVTEIPADATGDKAYTARWQEKVTVELDTRTQRFGYDGNGKEFVLKDADGNILPSFNSQSGEDWFVPCNFAKVIAPFGERTDPTTGASSYHQGVDLAAPLGTPVYASRSGQVSVATYNSSAGYYVRIEHPDGSSSLYMHLSSYDVYAGYTVSAGQLIGYVGQTGVATEPHLHFGITYNGAYVNPEDYVNMDGEEEKFCIDYSYSGMQLNEDGLPYESGSYSLRITRPETATCKAVDLVIKPAIIIVPASGKCGNDLIWEFDKDTGILTISGSGWMYDFSPDNPAPWNVYAGSIKELNINNLNTSISSYAFAECHALTSITIPDSVYGIRDAAFSGCTSLKTITFDGDSPSIAENAFAGVTVTAYYPAGWNWYEDDFADYGGKITWVETGVEAKKLTVSLPETMVPGMRGQYYVTVRPWNATGDFAVTVSDSDVLEFESIENDYINIRAVKAGTSTVTVKELRSGLEYSGDITVVEPQVISVPCSMNLPVPEGDSLQYLSFTPAVSGSYRFWSANIEHMTLSNGGYGDSISVLDGSEWVESQYYSYEESSAVVVNLNAGKTYTIIVPFYLSAYEQTAVFTAEKVNADSGASETVLYFGSNQLDYIFTPGEYSWQSIHATYNGTEPLTWSSSNPSVVEITDTYTSHSGCRFKIHSEGTAILTVSNGVLSDSVTITTKEAEFVELYLPVTKVAETDYFQETYAFAAPEAGRYAFCVSSEDGSGSILFKSSSSAANEMFSYGESSCTGFRTMEAGEVCSFYVSGRGSSFTVRVSKAAAKPLSMKVVARNLYSDQIHFGVSFTPTNACEKVVKWEIGNRDIASESSNPKWISNEMTYEIFKDGILTVTATSESGLTASLTVEVHPILCPGQHNYGDWIPVLDENGEQTGRERRTCGDCNEYQERKMPPLDETVENRVILDASDLAGHNTVWIDGAEYTLSKHGNKCYVDLPNGNARTMVTYTYNSSLQTRYPVGMKVWTLNNGNGVYTVTRQESFDDILQYSGMSIRVTGKKGIRMITAMEQSKKNALTSDGLEGFTLKEYGTAIAWASQISCTKPLVLGKSYVSSNYAYKKGVADPVFAYSGDLMQYTNVLVNFSDDQCKDDIAMRPYMILEDEHGEELTIYGGIVNRSIGYIAYQNRNVFEPQTDEYSYIWDIIHYVYGDVYDDEFIHAWTPSTK